MSSFAQPFKPGSGTALPNMGQTEAEINAAVAAEIEAEIAGQISPLEDLIRQYGGNEAAAIEKMNQLYGTIMPSVQNSVTNLRSDFDKSIGFEKGIYDATQARLAGVRAQAGAQAQSLAQQLGANIPLSLFDAGSSLEQGLGAVEGAGSLLTASGLRDASLAEAEAFSGRVFPLMRKESEEEIRRTYGSQIASLQKEIATIKKMKPGLVNERTRTRLLEERGYQLERVKSQRDWQLAKYSTNLETKKLNEAKKARIAADKLTKRAQDLQAKAAAAGETTQRRGQDLSAQAEKARLKAQQAERAANNKEYEVKRAQAIRDNVTAAVQAFIAGGTAKLKTVQKEANGSYTESIREVPTGEGAITNPNQLLEAVRAAVPGSREMEGYLTKTVTSALRAKGIDIPKDWVEGQATGKATEKNTFSNVPTRRVMNTMDLAELERWAKLNMGFAGRYPPRRRVGKEWKDLKNPGPVSARNRKAWLIDWITRKEVEAGGNATYGPR